MQDFSRKRREQLESSIQENVDLLGQYRRRRNSSSDPRERARLDGEIKDLNELIEKEQQELESLDGNADPKPVQSNSELTQASTSASSKNKKEIYQPNKGMEALDENQVFVSYAWGGESEHMVDELEQTFSAYGIPIVRDKKDLEYKGSIDEFERRIGQGQCVILVISDKYLRSEHCMYELVEVDGNHNVRDRIFPIVLRDARIFTPLDRLSYIQYWDEKIEKLNQAIKATNSIANLSGITDDLDKYTRIRASIAHLTDLLRDINTLTPELHASSGFTTIITAIRSRMTRKKADRTKGSNASPVGALSPDPISIGTTGQSLGSYSGLLEAKREYLGEFEKKLFQSTSNFGILITAQGELDDLTKMIAEITEEMQEHKGPGKFPLSDLKRMAEVANSINSLVKSATGVAVTGKNPTQQLNQISQNLPLLKSLVEQLSLWLEKWRETS